MIKICDCCCERSMFISTCQHGHKLCKFCKMKSNKKECLFCSPFGEENVDSFTLFYKNNIIILTYFFSLLFLSFYIEGAIFLLYDLIINFIFVDNNIIFFIYWYFPNVYNLIYQLLINILIVFSLINFYLLMPNVYY